MKKVTISKMTAREIILITSAFRKPHFTGAEINGNRSYALLLSIRDSKKDFPLLRDGKPFAFGNVFTRFTLIMNFLHLLPVRKPHRWKQSGLPLPDAGG